MFFNTTNKKGKDLKKAVKQTKSQNQSILEYMIKVRQSSASQLFKKKVLGRNVPITSYRRALTTLVQKGVLIKTSGQTMGIYGRLEHIYFI